ncbi:MAG: cysteine--tRNA ligase [Armatimonadetes bacterium]|nr:cysteine--tRNA ligase [Armatimonadota bacterium]
MALRIFNTLTRQKEELVPLQPGRVNMYVCGPTVYDLPHIGHAKSYVSFDGVVRYLRHRGYDVLYVQNITDVGHLTDDADEGEDKVLRRARERRIQPMVLVEYYMREYFRCLDALNVLRPDISPRATGHIPEMIDLIQRLIEEGHAYVAEGNVYFDVTSFPQYGKLSHRRLDEQEMGRRVGLTAGKRHPADFALWKAADPSHIMRWNSPWGPGYPGWHIECSAMSMKYLGETFDIHGAGVDNLFPHNEDEVAQSEAAIHRPFARIWMHNGTVLVDGEKMSKSKGNFVTIDEGIQRHGAMRLRFYVMNSHYRSPLGYTDAAVAEAGRAFERLQIAVQSAARYRQLPAAPGGDAEAGALRAQIERHRQAFYEAMDDDFNTPAALAALFGLATEMNRVTAAPSASVALQEAVGQASQTLLELGEVLGLDFRPPAPAADDLVPRLVELLLSLRQSLRQQKNYAAADEIRFRLQELGIIVEDRPEGPTWRRAAG